MPFDPSRLADRLAERGITESNASRWIGQNASLVGYITRGTISPSIHTLIALAALCEVDPGELFDDGDFEGYCQSVWGSMPDLDPSTGGCAAHPARQSGSAA